MRKLFIVTMLLLIFGLCESGFAGTAFIPIWQHGYGVSYINNLINTSGADAMMTLNLYDTFGSGTYTTSRIVGAGVAWITSTGDPWYKAGGGPDFGFGWGKVESTGAARSMFVFGAITGTLSGKVIGLTVLAPETGF
ncbi:MAG: hypothetical protein A2161_07625 [Candidatus Schekmanbacteria bacterium RBG_13_48_7]|uniref:Uncharacterized protein n=1 Tax=Candidatus Schekmanbacteria bacterium RBG_13_48_7 TaxID=1817878 RepID=A0A1F7S3E1_9BACT|nr:MAG: hypothetical protein A2161_07625 [Candidatus Schekmanbacteria bacterium RBG_13_48_7]